MNILFTICGRAGSKGLKNKNLKLLNGIPLVYYTLSVIKLYQQKHKEDHVMVALNTDSKELIKVVEEQDFIKEIFIAEREEKLAGDAAPKVEVIQSTYKQFDKECDAVVDLDITSPIRRLIDVENAINKLKGDLDCDVVFSVVPSRRSPYFNMVEYKDKYYKKICQSNYTARQQAPKTYEMNASIYAYNPQFLKKEINKTLLEYNCNIVEMPDYLVLDIDSQEDFQLMEILLKVFSKKDKKLNEVISYTTQIGKKGKMYEKTRAFDSKQR